MILLGNIPPQTTPTPNIMSLQGAIPPGQTQIMKPPVKEEAPKPVKMERPIPAEHMILQQTYDALVEKCRSASQSPVSFTVAWSLKLENNFLDCLQ